MQAQPIGVPKKSHTVRNIAIVVVLVIIILIVGTIASVTHTATTANVSLSGSSFEPGTTTIGLKSSSGAVYTASVTSAGDINTMQLPPATYTTTIHYTVSETDIPSTFAETCPGNSIDLTNDGGSSITELFSCQSYPTVVIYGTFYTTALGTTAQTISFGSAQATVNTAGTTTYFIIALTNNQQYSVTIGYTTLLTSGTCSAGTLNLNSYSLATDVELYSC